MDELTLMIKDGGSVEGGGWGRYETRWRRLLHVKHQNKRTEVHSSMQIKMKIGTKEMEERKRGSSGHRET